MAVDVGSDQQRLFLTTNDGLASPAWMPDGKGLLVRVSQLPVRCPSCFAPLTRLIPAAKSGLSRPESAASFANRRTTAIGWLMVLAARQRDSRCMRQRSMTTRLKASRGSEQYRQ